MAAVKEANSKMYMTKTYPSMQSHDSAKSRYRHILQKSDFRTLYRQLHHLQGVKIAQHDHINIDEWLDPTSSQYNKVLDEAIFHYSARTTKTERLEVCIATPEMKEAAWKYAHKSQIMVDGTFGVCNKKMLLFIVMGVDEANRGVPLAFFLFSAPADNKQTSAGYDTDVLERMLDHWKSTMESRNGEVFDVWVAITDTDLMERGALLRVFSNIWLLICRFHLRQSWKNHRNTCLKGGTATHMDLKGRLKRLEDALVETELHTSAMMLLHQERETLAALQASEAEITSGDNSNLVAVDGALRHVQYLEDYWGRESLWRSWSKFGRLAAAALIKRSVNEVLPTTNHLESFNGVLKRTYLVRWQKGGRRLRLDVLINILVLKILPSVFLRHKLEDMESARRKAIITSLPGGADLLRAKHSGSSSSSRLAFLISDDVRDRAAAALVSNNQIGVPSVDVTGRIFTFTCLSSLAIAQEASPITYQVVLNVDRDGSCTCKDFVTRGGACKHLRAALVRTVILRASGISLPALCLPSSLEEAYTLRGKHLAEMLAVVPSSLSSLELSDSIKETTEAVADLLEAGGMSEDDEDEGDTIRTVDSACATRAAPAVMASVEKNLDSRQGLDDQTLARALFDLEHSAPKLKQLGQWLKDTHLSPGDVKQLQRVEVAKTDLDILTGQLNRLVLEAQQLEDAPPSHIADPSTRPRTPPPRTVAKRRVAEIIGPSPEKRASKRHDSHGVH